MLLRLYSNSPSGSQLTVVNGTVVTGYTITNDIDLGNAVWQHAKSGKRGTQGARPAAGEPDNRVVSIPVHIGPTGSVDSCNVKAALICEIVDDMRRFGGQILWQATGQTPRQWLEVMEAGVAKQSWGRKGAIVDTADLVILADCAPYMLGDLMDTLDAFETDSIADYTLDAGGAGTLSVAGGLLVPSATGLKRYRYTAKGYTYADVQVTLKVRTGATLTNGVWGVTTRADVGGIDTLLSAEIVAGTNVLRIASYVAGVKTDLVTAAFTPVASTTYWVRLRVEGGFINAFVYAASTNAPGPSATSLQATAIAVPLARSAPAHCGLRIFAADTAERYGPFLIEPFTYSNTVAPEQFRLNGTIPGDVSALVDATISPSGNTATPIWGLAGWLERPIVPNLVWNGDFEDATVGTAGWATGATGIIAAATSVTRITTAARVKYGGGALQIITPATADTGAAFQIYSRFKRGRVYAALLWASSASDTTAVRMKLGANGDIATGAAVALSTTPKVYSVTWAVGSGNEWGSAYVAFGVNPATATTMAIDGVIVVESPRIGLSAAIGSAGATTCTVYYTPSEVPGLLADGSLGSPFLAMIDQELVRVTAIDPVTRVWTIDRGVESSTAATHAQDALVVILPPLRPHFEGKGAMPAFGFVEADGHVAPLSSAGAGSFASTVDTNARGGTVMRWTPGTSGSQLASLVYFIDPNVLMPDDYTQGEIDVEVYLREAWATTLANMNVTLSAQPESGLTFGAERFTREFGNVGKLIQPATAKIMRPHRLGSIPMIVDRANPQRWRLKVALSCVGGATPTWDLDYFMLVATRARLASPTGEPNDTASPLGAYPDFIPYDASWGASSRMSKTLRSDGSALISAPGGYAYPAAGLGNVLEMPDGDCDFIVKVSGVVPDDETLDATGEGGAYSYQTDLHLAVTPRYTLARFS